jgi:hypothetical protein
MSRNSATTRLRPQKVPVAHIQPRMLTVLEAVAYVRRSRAALYVDIRAGVLEARKAGRRTLISVASLDRMLERLPPV